jgi:mRNA interferase RelE/StbE
MRSSAGSDPDVPYTVTFTSAAVKSLEKLDRPLIARMKTKILALAANPRPVGSIKLAGASNLYQVRVGVYRIIYAVDDEMERVDITIVAHRRESYRGLLARS